MHMQTSVKWIFASAAIFHRQKATEYDMALSLLHVPLSYSDSSHRESWPRQAADNSIKDIRQNKATHKQVYCTAIDTLYT